MSSNQQALLWYWAASAGNGLLTNLVFYIKLDEAVNSNITDSVWSKTWTRINQANTSDTSPTLINRYGVFDGNRDYFRFDDHTDFDFWTWAVSFSFWCYQTSLVNYKYISNQRFNNGSGWAQVGLFTQPWSAAWNSFAFYIYNWSTGQQVWSTNGSHSANVWEHWVFTRSSDGVTMKAYKNWSLDNTATTTAKNWDNNWYLSIWENIWQPWWWNGRIDEYWIWKWRELTLSDVELLYNSWSWLSYDSFTS